MMLAHGDTLLIATHNAGKLAEFRELFAPYGLNVVSAGEKGLPEPDETADSFLGNAQIKAHSAAKASGLPSLADDSGLAVDGLDGAPGIYSARWGGPNKDFFAAMQRVHDELTAKGFTEPQKRKAAFVAALVLALPDGREESVEARAEGNVVWPPRGNQGFGYDPFFLPEGESRTFGEMDSHEKHGLPPQGRGLSHRAKAFLLLKDKLFGAGP
jgi:XTP/dITP diphosphohydrolase